MIDFKPVRLGDRAVIERYTMPSGICNCDLAFANMYCWQAVFHSAWAEIGGFLVIRFQIDGGERIGYMQPVGEGDFGPILPLLREDAHAHGQRLRIIGLTDEGRDTIRWGWEQEKYGDYRQDRGRRIDWEDYERSRVKQSDGREDDEAGHGLFWVVRRWVARAWRGR